MTDTQASSAPFGGTDDACPMSRLQALLERRELARDGFSRWGLPSVRTVVPGHEPERFADASELQRRFVACAYATPSPGEGLCASWVEQAFSRLGLGIVLGDAQALYDSYCPYDDTANLRVGMIVACGQHPYTATGTSRGHVGIYVGDERVADAVGSEIRTTPLDLWLSAYGLMSDPRWGWLGSIGLS